MQPRLFASLFATLFAIVGLLFVLFLTPLYAQIEPSKENAIVQTSTPQIYWTLSDDIPLPRVVRPTPPPTITVTSEIAEGYIFLAPHERRPGDSPYSPYLLIIDNDGELVYHRKEDGFEDHTRFDDFKVLPNGLLVSRVGGLRAHQLQDTSYQPVGTLLKGADIHDIQLLPNGNYMLLFYRSRRIDMSQYVEGGDTNAAYTDCHLQEVDTAGNTLFTWQSGDHFAITDTYRSLLTSHIDAVHCNSVDVDSDGNLIISSRDLYEVTKIDKSTGDVIWRLGGRQNDFEFINAINAEHVTFEKQHDARWVSESNLTLFDNRLSSYSRAIEYEIDEENMTATLVWEHRRTPDLHGAILGNTQRLSNGNSLIGWGSSRISALEVTHDGTPLFELYLPSAVVSYRAYRYPWVGQPTTAPDLVVVREIITGTNPADIANTTAIKLAYSWNGATEVDAYQVYGDLSSSPQTLLATEQKNGFETTTVFTGNLVDTILSQGYNFRVVPLGRNGQPIMRQDMPSERVSSDVVSIASAVRDMVTLTPTATPTSSSTPSPTQIATRTQTPTPTATYTPTPSPTESATATPTKTATATPTQTATSISTLTQTATSTVTPSPTKTKIPTATSIATFIATATSIPTASSILTTSPTWTNVPISTAISTPVPTPMLTATATSPTATADAPIDATATHQSTITPPAVATATPTAMLIATETPTPTDTSMSISTPISTPIETSTAILIEAPTRTPTEMPTVIPTSTPTDTPAATTATRRPIIIISLTLTPQPVLEAALTIEVAPQNSDTAGPIQPGDRVVFVLNIANSGSSTAFDVRVVGTVPQHTSFDGPFSDPGWNLIPDPLSAASATGTCPDGYGAESQCQITIGDMTPGQSINGIRFAAIVDETVSDDVTGLNFVVELAGATIEGGDTDVVITNNADIIIGTGEADEAGTPTDLALDEEPLGLRLFLPYVSH